MKNLGTKQLAKIALVAALYSSFSIFTTPISSGIIQFRFAELLNLLAFIDPFYIVAVGLGCFITNIVTSPLGIIDVIFGTMSTVFAGYFVYKSKNLLLASIWPTIFTLVVSFEFYLLQDAAFIATAVSIAASQFVIVTIIGVPVFKILMQNKNLVYLLRIDKDSKEIDEKLNKVLLKRT